jgi:hypothetical protein
MKHTAAVSANRLHGCGRVKALGCVAKTHGGVRRGGELLLCGHAKQMVDDAALGEDIPLGDPLKLPFVEHMHGFIALDGPLCRVKCSKILTPDSRGI